MRNSFKNIRIIAGEHFYIWPEGEDFYWLKSEWHNFMPHFKDGLTAESFILAMRDIYYSFCIESYFGEIEDEDWKRLGVIDDDSELTEEEKQKRVAIDKTLDVLLEVYDTPGDIILQFTSIYVKQMIPRPEGYRFLVKLFQNKNKPEEFVW
jgi:hypothetical protein